MAKFSFPVSHLELSIRTANCLRNGGFDTIGDLARSSEEELLMLGNFGRKSLNEIKEVLASFDITIPRLRPRSDIDSIARLLGRYHATKAAYQEAKRELRELRDYFETTQRSNHEGTDNGQ